MSGTKMIERGPSPSGRARAARAAIAILAAAGIVVTATAVGPVRADDDGSLEGLRKKLSAVSLDLDLRGAPIDDAFAAVRDRSGLNLIVSSNLREVFADDGARLDLELRDVSAWGLLELLGELYEFEVAARDGVVVIQELGESLAGVPLTTRMHDVSDLVVPIRDFPGPVFWPSSLGDGSSSGASGGVALSFDDNEEAEVDLDVLIELVTGSLPEDVWDRGASIVTTGRTLIVTLPPDAHRRVDAILGDLRRHAASRVSIEAQLWQMSRDVWVEIAGDRSAGQGAVLDEGSLARLRRLSESRARLVGSHRLAAHNLQRVHLWTGGERSYRRRSSSRGGTLESVLRHGTVIDARPVFARGTDEVTVDIRWSTLEGSLVDSAHDEHDPRRVQLPQMRHRVLKSQVTVPVGGTVVVGGGLEPREPLPETPEHVVLLLSVVRELPAGADGEAGSRRDAPIVDGRAARLRELLERRRVTLEHDDEPLDRVLEKLAEDAGINLVVAPGYDLSEYSVAVRLRDVPLRLALDLMLGDNDLAYHVRENVLLITEGGWGSASWVDAVEVLDVRDLVHSVRSFPGGVSDLVIPSGDGDGESESGGNVLTFDEDDGDDRGPVGLEADRLIEIIEQLVDPTGEGMVASLEIHGGVLVVRASPAAIERIRAILGSLRKLARRLVTVEYEVWDVPLSAHERLLDGKTLLSDEAYSTLVDEASRKAATIRLAAAGVATLANGQRSALVDTEARVFSVRRKRADEDVVDEIPGVYETGVILDMTPTLHGAGDALTIEVRADLTVGAEPSLTAPDRPRHEILTTLSAPLGRPIYVGGVSVLSDGVEKAGSRRAVLIIRARQTTLGD